MNVDLNLVDRFGDYLNFGKHYMDKIAKDTLDKDMDDNKVGDKENNHVEDMIVDLNIGYFHVGR